MPNYGRTKTSPSLGSGRSAAARTPFRGLRTTNPQSNFGTNLTLGRMSRAGGTGGASRVSDAPVQAAAVAGDGTVDLSWAAPVASGGAEVTNYEIHRGVATGVLTLLDTVGAVLTYEDTTVDNDTEYFYAVAAVNASGTSALSNEVSATPTA